MHAPSLINKSWRCHLTIEQLYIPKIIKSIRMQRLRFADHFWRNTYELARDMLLWQPQHGKHTRVAQRRHT